MNERQLWTLTKSDYEDDDLCRIVLAKEALSFSNKSKIPVSSLLGYACEMEDLEKIRRYATLSPDLCHNGHKYKPSVVDLIVHAVTYDRVAVYNRLLSISGFDLYFPWYTTEFVNTPFESLRRFLQNQKVTGQVTTLRVIITSNKTELIQETVDELSSTWLIDDDWPEDEDDPLGLAEEQW